MSKRTDYLFGRRGGRFLPDDYSAVDFDNAPICDVCGLLMILGQKKRHYACDPDTMIGERCLCRPGCTDELVGDGMVDCEAACVPCRLQRNRLHSSVDEWRRFRS